MKCTNSFERFENHQGESPLPNIRFGYPYSYWKAIEKLSLRSRQFSLMIASLANGWVRQV